MIDQRKPKSQTKNSFRLRFFLLGWGVGAVHKKKKGTKLSGEEDLTAPKTEGSTLMPETVEKKKEVIYY